MKNPWREAVHDALVVDWLFSKELACDPRKAIAAIIRWNQKLVLDPKVSADAARLVARAKYSEHRKCCDRCSERECMRAVKLRKEFEAL